MNKLIKVATSLLLFAAIQVSASQLGDFKAKGIVGEKNDGYVGLVVQHPEAAKLVDEINEKRRQRYLQLARQNGVPLESVAMLAAEKTIQKTKAGHFIQDANGKWKKK